MEFPYGRASLGILLVTLVAAAGLLGMQKSVPDQRPDIVFATFTKEHALAYRKVLPIFEAKHHCHVQLQVVDQRALQSRLQSAMQVGAEVPDMFEMMDGYMSFFTRGSLQDIQLVDLTDRLRQSGLDKQLVSTRFIKWSSRGRVFALPHDVHPTMLAYRKDLIDQLHIDVNQIDTWDKFSAVGRQIARDYKTADGVPRHYMFDMPADGQDILPMLALQRGGTLFDESGGVAFDSDAYAHTVVWYVQQIQGDTRISFPAGWGQNLAKAVYDGVVLFVTCPDWRTFQFWMDMPGLSGKMALMPLPAWEPGGLRSSTWGATGLAFPKRGRNFDLAWELANFLYYDPPQLGPRFLTTNILPPLKTAWRQPEFSKIDPYWNISLGQTYIPLALQVPAQPQSPYYYEAISRLNTAFTRVSEHYAAHGSPGLLEHARQELHIAAEAVREQIRRNRFLGENVQASSVTAAVH